MRTTFLLIFMAAFSTASAQELQLVYGGARAPVREMQVEIGGHSQRIWFTTLENEGYFVIRKSVVDSLLKKIEQQQAIISHHEQVIAHTDTLLDKYEKFSLAANRHVRVQEKLIATADTLFRSYRAMYRDLKRIMGIPKVALVGDLGLVDPPGGGWRPVGGFGLSVRHWQAVYRFGKDYRGFSLALRWPVGY